MFPRLLFFLFWAIWAVSADSITLPTTIEIDLVFPLNQTYTLIDPFPVIFVIQNAAAAWDFGFDFEWNITGVPDEPSGSGFFSGWLMVGPGIYYPDRPTPSDPFIVVNSTRFVSAPELPSVVVNNPLLAAGKWTLSWSYESSICTPYGDILEIGSGVPAQGSISFTVEGGGASPDFTSSCPILAGQIDIVANWTGCPQVGTPGTSNPCGAKIDAAQASSISAVLALSTSTSSATGGSLVSGATGTLTMSGSSASSATSTSTTSANIAGREQLGSGLLGVAAGIAGFGILLL
jgi:hypothetical protein